MENEKNKYDLVVVGGGPAGMMSAGRASEKGARVLLLEKNNRLGVKLLITGKGRCNITNSEDNLRAWIEKFGDKGKFLYKAFNIFNNHDVINFFEKQGVATKIERGGRIFPESDRSQDILRALEGYLAKSSVEICFNASVKRLSLEQNNINYLELDGGKKIFAKHFIVSTGGKSYPITGSSGDGYNWLRDLGHKIMNPAPALVPVLLKEDWVKCLEGLSLRNVEISLYQNNKKLDSRFGEALFTDRGMSGPIVLDMSKRIGEFLSKGSCQLRIDFKPRLDFPELDRRLQQDFQEQNNKDFKNSLDKLLPKKIIPVIIQLSGIFGEKKVNLITKEERKRLLHLLKDFRLEVRSLDSFDKAIITNGGVALSEINPNTMKSKIVENLSICGEILDIDGPTGGYNLQVAWSTGYLAGEKVIA